MDSRQGSPSEAGHDKPVPEVCPYCGSPAQKKAFSNGTVELRCIKTTPQNGFEIHSYNFYLKPSR